MKKIIYSVAATTAALTGALYLASNYDTIFDALSMYQGTTSLSEEYQAFIEFVSKYGKTYASKDAHHSRFQVFKQNYLKVKEHNTQSKKNSYKLGINRFSDLTEEEFLRIYATLKEHKNEGS